MRPVGPCPRHGPASGPHRSHGFSSRVRDRVPGEPPRIDPIIPSSAANAPDCCHRREAHVRGGFVLPQRDIQCVDGLPRVMLCVRNEAPFHKNLWHLSVRLGEQSDASVLSDLVTKFSLDTTRSVVPSFCSMNVVVEKRPSASEPLHPIISQTERVCVRGMGQPDAPPILIEGHRGSMEYTPQWNSKEAVGRSFRSPGPHG